MNSSMFKIRFLGPTDYRGARIAVSTYDLVKRDSRAKTMYLNYDYSARSGDEQAMKAIEAAGFEIIGSNERGPETIVLCKWNYELMLKFFKVKDTE